MDSDRFPNFASKMLLIFFKESKYREFPCHFPIKIEMLLSLRWRCKIECLSDISVFIQNQPNYSAHCNVNYVCQ